MAKLSAHDIKLLENASLDQRLVQALSLTASMVSRLLEKFPGPVLTLLFQSLTNDLIDERYFQVT